MLIIILSTLSYQVVATTTTQIRSLNQTTNPMIDTNSSDGMSTFLKVCVVLFVAGAIICPSVFIYKKGGIDFICKPYDSKQGKSNLDLNFFTSNNTTTTTSTTVISDDEKTKNTKPVSIIITETKTQDEIKMRKY
jgi:hypothetical protein